MSRIRAKQKGLGKEVVVFKRDVWGNDLERILLRGLRARFHQNPNCADFLRRTGEKIYEASPKDTFCGAGLNVFDRDI